MTLHNEQEGVDMRILVSAAAMLLASTATAPLAAQAIAPNDGSTFAATDGATPTQFEVYLPLRDAAGLKQLVKDQQTVGSPSYHQWLTPAQFAARFGPAADAVARIKTAAATAGFTVLRTDARSLLMSGTVSQVSDSFHTVLMRKTSADGQSKLVATSQLKLPAAFAAEGAVVISYTDTPNKRPLATKTSLQTAPENRYGTGGPYWYNDLKQAYDYPAYNSFLPNGQRLDGTGVGVAVLMADKARPTDITQFFNHEKFATNSGGSAVPTFTTININGGGAIDGPAALEATLDLQQVLGGAPGSTVALISIPNLSNANILAGYNYIVNQNQWALVNSSFGGCELAYTAAYNGGVDYTNILDTYQQIFEQGNAQGITFVASSGDEGGLECPDSAYFYGHDPKARFVPSVSDPADSPNVTAVGGTNLVTNQKAGSLDSTYASENGFGDPEQPTQPYGKVLGVIRNAYWGAGGGQSGVYARPFYQEIVNTGTTTARTLPDVGMQVGGCPSSAIQPCGANRSSVIVTYDYGFGGGNYSVIGTSVSSPEFVGALALFVQANGRQGNFNPYLYAKGAAQTAAGGINAPDAQQYYHRNISGFDGAWDASFPSLNYNYIVGNGTPDVRKLFGFTNFKSAGVPQTSTNP